MYLCAQPFGALCARIFQADPVTERLFFALWPDAAVRQVIYKETRQTVRASGGKPVPPENFHITLAFLGSVDTAVADAAREAAAGIHGQGFHLSLDRLGFWHEPRVVWLGASDVPPAGRRLAASLLDALHTCGLTPDPKPFLPHVTLVRKVSRPGDPGPAPVIHWPVEAFVLVRSITRAQGSEYRLLDSWRLTAWAAG
ncbi:MAG: RNA 2',3'-cyclic phosphodiesterase [Gammaproteobacteria bacterium]|nr:RNA 2',3'-cyclic phosphodiesterase [Gammaproteobacteria bacterium]